MKTNIKNVTYKPMKYSKHMKDEILLHGMYHGLEVYIISRGTHPTAYVEVPRKSEYYKKHYDKIPIDVHGGLTYSGEYVPSAKNWFNKWFIGWDYAHFGDYLGFNILYENSTKNRFINRDKKWTTEEMFEDVTKVVAQIEKTY